MTGRPETQVEGGGTQAVVESLVPQIPSLVKDINKTIIEVRSKHGVDIEDMLHTLVLLEGYLCDEVLRVSLANC